MTPGSYTPEVRWEITSELHWPQHLIEGEYPNRGQVAVEQEARLQRLLTEGWEPFSVHPLPESSLVWLKRRLVNSGL